MKKFEELFADFKPQKKLEPSFKKIATELMTKFAIKVNETEFYLTEIEFYCKTENERHNDPYVHGNDLQKKLGKWYFHPSGLDLTFGTSDYYGGLLIRGIKTSNNHEEWEYTSGPINVVRELFSKAKIIDEPTKIQLVPTDKKPIENGPFFSTRVGLNDKINENYFFKKYRAITDISTKHKFAEKTKVAQRIKDSKDIDVNSLFGYNILK